VLWSMRHSCAAGEVGTGVADVEDAAVRDGDALGGGGEGGGGGWGGGGGCCVGWW